MLHEEALIQRPAEAEQRECHGRDHEDEERGDIHVHIGEAVALQHDAADDADEMGERQYVQSTRRQRQRRA